MKNLNPDLKYFVVLTIPVAVFFSLYSSGIFCYTIPIMNFIGVPILDMIFPSIETNLSEDQEKKKLNNRFFDWLLYINVPFQFFLLFYTLYVVVYGNFELWENVGKVWSMGICSAVLGINTAHELGHRKKKYEQFLSKLLLMSAGYMHFFIEHNRGHHKHVSTPVDPAFARKNQSLFSFFFRSIPGQWFAAWAREKHRLQKLNMPQWSFKNEMLQYQIIQSLFIFFIFLFFGWKGVLVFLCTALIGILIMETINYIEHYGLERKEITPGKYEKIQPHHSWNSDHILGRIMLFELTRHSDHHYKASRKYQVLRHFDQSPQLFLGYPGSLVLAWFPPLWFKVMNPRLPDTATYAFEEDLESDE